MNRTASNTTPKSKGHIEFLGDYEYFTDDAGELYRASIDWPVQVDGRRWGRWECSAWMVESMMQVARQTFAS